RIKPAKVKRAQSAAGIDRPPTDAELRARLREDIIAHFDGLDPETGRLWLRGGNRYVRSTGTWYGLCNRCLGWVRDGHAAIEADLGVWAGRLAEQKGADDNAALELLYDHALPVVRELFGVADLDAFDAESAHLPGRRDDEFGHKSRCVPAVFKIVDPAE